MKIPIFFVLLSVANFSWSTVLWSQDFTSGTSGFYTSPGMTRNAGNTYACVSGNSVYYTSSSNAYIETNTIQVPQGKSVKLTFDSRRKNTTAGSIKIYYLITGACSWSNLNPANNGWVLWSTITPNTSALSPGGCTSQSVELNSAICGGQDIAILMYFENASGTNWISVDNISVSDDGTLITAIPNITGATTYTENITNDKWYGPVNNGNFATTGVVIPYHSYKSSSSGYTYLWTGGSGGTANHSGNASDYYAAFYTGFEYCDATGSSQIISKELNTSACASAEIKFAFKAKYPCTAANYDYTFDENYNLYAPKLYTSTGRGYNWTQQNVNYYFPDGLWHFATYSVPSSSNIKIRLSRGGSCTTAIEGVDQIKVLCRDCSISSLSAGTISGESNPAANTDYTYTITPTAGATYYKWMIRAIDRDPPVMIEAACPNGTDPCIVSGQGTTSCTINFGNNPGTENFRVVCIPYDANPGTLAAPSDACYAKLALFPTTVLPLSWGYFNLIDKENYLSLEWSTLSEENTSHFEIEKANENEVFFSIGTIPASGNSNTEIKYSFTDDINANGIFYYRIKQLDHDGKYSYSPTLSLISENPSKGINIKYNEDGFLLLYSDYEIKEKLTLGIYSILGEKLLEYELPFLSQGESKINISNLPKGPIVFSLYGQTIDFRSKSIAY